MFDVLFAIGIGLWLGLAIGIPLGIEMAYKRQQLIKGDNR